MPLMKCDQSPTSCSPLMFISMALILDDSSAATWMMKKTSTQRVNGIFCPRSDSWRNLKQTYSEHFVRFYTQASSSYPLSRLYPWLVLIQLDFPKKASNHSNQLCLGRGRDHQTNYFPDILPNLYTITIYKPQRQVPHAKIIQNVIEYEYK